MSGIVIEHGSCRIELTPIIDEGPLVQRTIDGNVVSVTPTIANYSLDDLEHAVAAMKRAVDA